jgi:hypothetical protein
MQASFTASCGLPWVDDDPRCRSYEEAWRAGWESAAIHAPQEAVLLAEVIDAKYAAGACQGLTEAQVDQFVTASCGRTDAHGRHPAGDIRG